VWPLTTFLDRVDFLRDAKQHGDRGDGSFDMGGPELIGVAHLCLKVRLNVRVCVCVCVYVLDMSVFCPFTR
jgi:hypothetical protein